MPGVLRSVPAILRSAAAILWSIALQCSAPAILWSIALLRSIALLWSAPAILRLRLGHPNHSVILASSPDERSEIRDIPPECSSGCGRVRHSLVARRSDLWLEDGARISLRSSGLHLLCVSCTVQLTANWARRWDLHPHPPARSFRLSRQNRTSK
jgi:hypothetical protein